MDISWSLQIPDPQRQDRGQTLQTAVSAWLIESAYQLWTERNTQRNTPDPTTDIDTALRETTAQIHHIYRLIDEHLSAYDRHELVKETLGERLLLPEHTNGLWAKQIYISVSASNATNHWHRTSEKFSQSTLIQLAAQSEIDPPCVAEAVRL